MKFKSKNNFLIIIKQLDIILTISKIVIIKISLKVYLKKVKKLKKKNHIKKISDYAIVGGLGSLTCCWSYRLWR
jgi:hypothetical protein